MLEIEYVMLAQKGNKESISYLYTKYIGLVHKTYRRYSRFLCSVVNQEDFSQDSFHSMMKAVKYCNPGLITNEDSWLFVGLYKYALRGLVQNYMRVDKLTIKTNSISEPSYSGNRSLNSDKTDNPACIEDLLQKSYGPSSEDAITQKDMIKYFYTLLSPKEVKVVRLLIKYKTLEKVGEEMNLSKERIRQLCLPITIKYNKMMREFS